MLQPATPNSRVENAAKRLPKAVALARFLNPQTQAQDSQNIGGLPLMTPLVLNMWEILIKFYEFNKTLRIMN